MTRAALLAAAAALVTALPSQAWAAPRDGRVEQAMADTVAASLSRRGINGGATGSWGETPGTTTLLQHTWALAHDALINRCGLAAGGLAVGQLPTFYTCVRGLINAGFLSPPFDTGLPGYFGGGGATGGWGEGEMDDCGDIDFSLDVQGNLVIPSMPLSVGTPIGLNTQVWWTDTLWDNCLRINNASTEQAAARRYIHCQNLFGSGSGDKRKFAGVYRSAGGVFYFASVAYRNTSGNIVGRWQASINPSGALVWDDPFSHGHQACPPTQGGGVDHYYLAGNVDAGGGHTHTCITYVPNLALGPQGDAYSPVTSLVTGSTEAHEWPKMLPAHLQGCPISPDLIAKMTEAVWKDAADEPGYDGAPPEVKPEDSRPGDTKVEDLADQPPTTTSTPPEPNPSTPPPPTTQPSGYKDECDFGATGCTDPGTPQPTIEEVSTGIMDPIFEWLPDLPSITFDANASECPVWAVNLTEFGGPEWQFLIDKQCPLLEDNRAAIGALMIALFGMAAALVILRA